ncbi:hypothetical protein ACSSWA_01630 [Melioribacter sp. Ez-97]|uniref:hypothetical protein n=1 Tax=Melioribacter sp. Ez-97 TaxID=3423434 RepID=UPI003ED8E0FF
MKKIFILIILSSIVIYAQPERQQRKGWEEYKKFEQLEKAKIIEILDLNEEEAVRFFAKRNEYRNEVRKLLEKRKELVRELEENLEKKNPDNNYYKKAISEINSIDMKIGEEKRKFYRSLEEILETNEIAKLIVFEYTFRRDMARKLMKRDR